MFHDEFGARLARAPTRWIEPPWKAILSNKGILPLLWEMFPDHPNLLPAYFEDDPNAARASAPPSCASRFIRAKAPTSRWSATAPRSSEQEGPYGAEGFIRQALARLPNFSEPISGGRKLAGRPHPVRAIDPRGRKSDHRQYVAVPAARDPLRLSAPTRFNPCGVDAAPARAPVRH